MSWLSDTMRTSEYDEDGDGEIDPAHLPDASEGGVTPLGLSSFRLSSQSGVAVPTSEQSDVGTVYLTPLTGDVGQLTLWDGSKFTVYEHGEVSISLSGKAAGAYDVWAFADGSNIDCELLAWTNSTTRATALVGKGAFWAKTGVLTRRLVGSIYLDATGQTQDTLTEMFIANADNRVLRIGFVDASSSHSYSTGSWRQWESDTSKQVSVMVAIADHAIDCRCSCYVAQSGGDSNHRIVATAIGVDSTSTPSGEWGNAVTNRPDQLVLGMHSEVVAVGKHDLTWLQNGGGGGTQWWYNNGTNGAGGMRVLAWL